MNTASRDAEAHFLYESGHTWAQVAIDLHYANGSVARRAAMRHVARAGAGEQPVTDTTTEPVAEPVADTADETADDSPTVEAEPISTRPAWEKGMVLTHVGEPKATYRFVKWNADGSAQVWGGDSGHEMMRDFRVETLREKTTKPARRAS